MMSGVCTVFTMAALSRRMMSSLHRAQVVEQQSDLLLRRSGRGASEKDYRRLGDIAQSEQEREIRIGRNDDPVLARSARKYLLVTCCLHPIVAQVHTVVTVPA